MDVAAHTTASAPRQATQEPSNSSEEPANKHDPEKETVVGLVLRDVGHDFLVALGASDFLRSSAFGFHDRRLLLLLLHHHYLRLWVAVHRLLHAVPHLHLLLLSHLLLLVHLLLLHLHVIELHLLVLHLQGLDLGFFRSDLRGSGLRI